MMKNSIWIGIIAGLVIPFVGYAVFLSIFDGLESAEIIEDPGNISAYFRQRTSAILAIALNLIPLNIFKKRRFDHAIRGIVLPTVGYAIFCVYYFGQYIL